MGIAAYNRGTAAIAAQFDAEARPVEFEIMERLNALPKYEDAGKPFGAIQFVHDYRGFWVAECPKNWLWFLLCHAARSGKEMACDGYRVR